jgi:ATP-binding cassette subfamily B multidrug efflux pump
MASSDEWDYEEEEEQEAAKRPFNRRNFWRMLAYARPYRRTLVAAGLFMFVVTLANLAEPIFIRYAVDQGIVGKNLTALHGVLVALVAARVVAWLAQGKQIRLIYVSGQNILYDLRRHLFDHIQTLSLQFYDGRPVGKIMSRITNDVNAIGQMVNSGLISIISQGLSLVGIMVLMLVMHTKLALLTFAAVPMLFLTFTYMRSWVEPAWLRVRRAVAGINGHLNETLQGIQVIQAFSREERNAVRFDRISGRYRRTYLRAISLELFFWPLTDVVAAVATAGVILYGAGEVVRGGVTIGLLLAFLSYMNKFWGPVSTFSRVYSQVMSAMASAERVFEFLDTKPLVVDAPGARPLPQIRGDVAFDGVCFEYEPGRPVLREMSFSVPAGTTVALVGPTGGGKSTMVNLVARFYDATAGTVSIDGQNLKEVTVASLRSQLGVVLQDTFIFSGSIKDNIRYGRLEADQPAIEEAARQARAHEFIVKTATGYETDAHERGATLSTGQRQLLAFARAILADPRILILDEATSSIDTETEALIQEALRVLLAGRTAFVIAHRLSTIRNADVIMVVDDGRIVEQGTHAGLLARRGHYWRLYQKQFSRELAERYLA